MPSKFKTNEFISFDAINGDGEFNAQRDWVLGQLNNDMGQLKSLSHDKRVEYLKTSPRFRGYHTESKPYATYYPKLDEAIQGWFKGNDAKNGTDIKELQKNDPDVFEQLHKNYKVTLEPMGKSSEHEAILGKPQDKFGGKGALEEALSALPLGS